MPYHTVREILALLLSSKNRPKIINKVMVKGRWEGSKARTKRESCMCLPPSQRKLTASLSRPLLSRKESSEPRDSSLVLLVSFKGDLTLILFRKRSFKI